MSILGLLTGSSDSSSSTSATNSQVAGEGLTGAVILGSITTHGGGAAQTSNPKVTSTKTTGGKGASATISGGDELSNSDTQSSGGSGNVTENVNVQTPDAQALTLVGTVTTTALQDEAALVSGNSAAIAPTVNLTQAATPAAATSTLPFGWSGYEWVSVILAIVGLAAGAYFVLKPEGAK